jgi:ankyrin repeat protein
VRSACYIVRHGLNTAHFEIIRCLVRAGADVTRPNHFGGTCLINAVQSPELVSFLLESCCYEALKPGSPPVQDVVNAEDVQRKTALHYAVQENRIESVKMLLEHGADPTKVSKVPTYLVHLREPKPVK